MPPQRVALRCCLQAQVVMLPSGKRPGDVYKRQALTRADTGIAIGAGTDVAIDAADVVLMKSRLLDVPAAIRLSRATLRNIHENLFWAFFYNTIGIPLAAGVFIPLGLTLSPMFGAAAMSLSSFCVVSNALRLNLFKLRDARHDHKRHNNQNAVARTKEEPKTMKKTMQDVYKRQFSLLFKNLIVTLFTGKHKKAPEPVKTDAKKPDGKEAQ